MTFSVSALLTLAEREGEPDQGADFPDVIMEQIKFLKDQLGDQSPNSRTMATAWSAHQSLGPDAMRFEGRPEWEMEEDQRRNGPLIKSTGSFPTMYDSAS